MSKLIEWQNVVTKKTGIVPVKTWEIMRSHPLARGRYRKLREINEKPRHFIVDRLKEEEE